MKEKTLYSQEEFKLLTAASCVCERCVGHASVAVKGFMCGREVETRGQSLELLVLAVIPMVRAL